MIRSLQVKSASNCAPLRTARTRSSRLSADCLLARLGCCFYGFVGSVEVLVLHRACSGKVCPKTPLAGNHDLRAMLHVVSSPETRTAVHVPAAPAGHAPLRHVRLRSDAEPLEQFGSTWINLVQLGSTWSFSLTFSPKSWATKGKNESPVPTQGLAPKFVPEITNGSFCIV